MPEVIEEKQRVCESGSVVISEYIEQLASINSVDGIFYSTYLHCYHGMYSIPNINITVISSALNPEIKNKVDELNNMHGLVVSNYGLDININLCLSAEFSFSPYDIDGINKLRDLNNSTLIYDKYGVYGRLKNMADKLKESDSITGTESRLNNNTHNLVMLRPFISPNFRRS